MTYPATQIDQDGYPTDQYLDWIKSYDITQESAFDLLMDVLDNWWMSYGVKIQRLYRGERKVHMSTGGWSGNEDMIQALRSNTLFWPFHFYNHRAGGHFTFIFRNIVS